ncbi:predicted protein [Nematostella vectensis]|uniref:Mitochondrial genome maintenance exonuclease 1 n=1 Tax=Nematostella vectensis TaxID=45351 RepID=A7RZT1_NEMVE|nr:predicted protein [Nematostella vectensis]|eukprot:XP_001635107.1 predicted protein [Nematostella vectensis]
MGGLKYLSHEKTPSVTTILNSTKPLSLILKWRDKKKGELGEERFKKYQSEIRKRGTEFHSFIKNLSSGDGNAISDNINGSLASISSVLKDVTSVIATEKQVSHFSLGYSGYFDMLALFRGVPCIIEWKTSERPKPTLQDCYEYPLQVVAYAGAVNSSPYVSVPVTHCAVVIAYHDGSPAHVHALNLELCEKYWQKWLVKLFNYRQTNTILQ